MTNGVDPVNAPLPSPGTGRRIWPLILILTLVFVTTAFSAFVLGMNRYSPRRVTWEYRVYEYIGDGYDRAISEQAAYQNFIDPSADDLLTLGQEGWELAGCYLEMETAFPNFGDEDYVTGIRDNVRPQRLVLIFKRPVNPSDL